jgi:DNA-binding MarR family transcriptional regulator
MNTNEGEIPPQGQIEQLIFSNLRKIIKSVDIYSAKLRESTGISSSQLSCMLALENAGPISLSQLSKMVTLSPSMITSIVDQLEKKDFVKRIRSVKDRRIILIELTHNGKESLKNAPLSFQKSFMDGLLRIQTGEKVKINKSLESLLSLIVSEILIDSSILGVEDKLVALESKVLEIEPDLKEK